MSIRDLVAANTTNARAYALNAFKRWVASEGVPFERLLQAIGADATGYVFEATMDKFGVFLAFGDGARGRRLSKASVMQYYRQTKNWLLEKFAVLRPSIEPRLQKMARTLEKHCVKRENGGLVKKAESCTKSELKLLVRYLYQHAIGSGDYQDACVLVLLWHCFGRASDLSLVQRQQVSVTTGGILTVNFIRIKTSEEQCLALLPDLDVCTCPFVSMALALLTQNSPSVALLAHLPQSGGVSSLSLSTGAPLMSVLDPVTAFESCAVEDTPTKTATGEPGIHAYINRLLKRIGVTSGLRHDLTSHSFRRGGAQHANSESALSAQWIFDRGAWNLTATNKAFAYIFNTTTEDQKVAKVLSGWPAESTVILPDLTCFGDVARAIIQRVQDLLFSNCTGFLDPRVLVKPAVLEVLMASVLRSYPQLKKINPTSPAVLRIEQCVLASGHVVEDLLMWSSRVVSPHVRQHETSDTEGDRTTKDSATIREQSAIIQDLVAMNKALMARMDAAHTANSGSTRTNSAVPMDDEPRQDGVPCSSPLQLAESSAPPTAKRRKVASTSLRDVWYQWFASEPRMWDGPHDRKRKSNSKTLVGFMKLFCASGIRLQPASPRYREDVIELGLEAEAGLMRFLQQAAPKAKSAGTVLRVLRELHRSGALNQIITSYRRLEDQGHIQDPTPNAHTAIFEIAQVE